ncbi:MAG: metallophosphoesterase [Burkholderiaceae bacterium]
MRLQLVSDVHLESQPDWRFEPAPGADVLVVAGDVGSYHHRSRLTEEDFGLARFAPGRGPWRSVLYLPGNHEYDDQEFDDVHQRLRDACGRLGITWLERETLVIDSVRFIGTTLWSDFDALASIEAGTEAGADEAGGLPLHRQRAFAAANDYLEKFSFLRDGQRVLADGVREIALDCQAWLREALAKPFAGPTVAVTHFAPSLRSADPRFGLVPGTAGFCNALDELLPWAELWLHGHLHCAVDYVDTQPREGRPHRCRVVANPLGYFSLGEGEQYRSDLLIDVPPAAD